MELINENPVLERPISEETSCRITVLRFILSCVVVFFHNNKVLLPIIASGQLNLSNVDVWLHIPQFLFYFIFSFAPVPLFFAFSAFIQYKKADAYLVLLKKRARSIVLPLFSWPAIIIGGRVLIKFALIYFFPDRVSPELPFIGEWSAKEWIYAFLGDYSSGLQQNMLCEPFIMPFYFIRDLFIMILLSPVIKKMVQKAPIAYAFFLAFLYFTNARPFIVCVNALVFYSIGFYIACYNIDLLKLVDSMSWKKFAVLAVIIFIHVLISNKSCFCVPLSCLFYLKLSKTLISTNKKVLNMLKYLSSFSFFLYAVHLPYLLNAFTKGWFSHIQQNCFTDLAEYFILPTVVCVCGTAIGILCRKICPKLFYILNGGR